MRVVKSGRADTLPDRLVKEVESWVDHAAGCASVPSIQEADLLLELHESSFKVQAYGLPVQSWWLIVRDLREAVPERAVHRLILAEPWPVPVGQRAVARQLGLVLNDVCLGLNPDPLSGVGNRR